MIRNGRPVLDRFGVGEAHGLTPTQTVRRRPWVQPGHPGPVNQPGGKKGALWDVAQVHAYVAGEPIPALPDHDGPDDLLDAAEVGQLTGLAATTVLRYVLRETIIPAPDEMIHGQPHWRRQTIEEWLPNRPGRGAGGGRPNANGMSDAELMDLALKLRVVLGNPPDEAARALAGEHHESATEELAKLLAARDTAIQRRDEVRAEAKRFAAAAAKVTGSDEQAGMAARSRELEAAADSEGERQRAAEAQLREFLLGLPTLSPLGPSERWSLGARELGRLLDVSPMKASKIRAALLPRTSSSVDTGLAPESVSRE